MVLHACLALVALGVAADRAPPPRETRDGQRYDVQLARLRYSGGQWDPRPTGWTRLAWEVRQRTSVAIDLEIADVSPEEPALFDHPLLLWEGDRSFPPLSRRAVEQLHRHLMLGGTLLVDAADGRVDGPFYLDAVRELRRMLPDHPLVRVPNDHVFYKAFYLVDRQGGRVAGKPYLEGIFIDGRLAVIVATQDLGGAMARDAFGEWQFDVQTGGDAAREMTFRIGINLVMYALCLDYKEDQVHIPFILKRRR
ncbi:MAG: DUF4159 domain-containing protein [Myxococcota bacterium]